MLRYNLDVYKTKWNILNILNSNCTFLKYSINSILYHIKKLLIFGNTNLVRAINWSNNYYRFYYYYYYLKTILNLTLKHRSRIKKKKNEWKWKDQRTKSQLFKLFHKCYFIKSINNINLLQLNYIIHNVFTNINRYIRHDQNQHQSSSSLPIQNPPSC